MTSYSKETLYLFLISSQNCHKSHRRIKTTPHTSVINCLFFNFYLQHLCRHVLENQHKLMRFIQQQIRLCSTGTARILHKQIEDDDTPKRMIIPPAAYETKSIQVEHDQDNGHLFKVRGHCEFLIYVKRNGTATFCFRFVGLMFGKPRYFNEVVCR